MVHWYMVHGTLYHTTPYHIMYQTTPCTAPCTRSHHIIPHRPPCMTLASHNATPYYATLLRGFSSNYNSAVVVLYYVAQSTSDDRVTHLHSKNGHTTMWVLQQSLYNTVLAASYQSQDNIWRICKEKESQPHRLPSQPLSSPFVTHKFQASVVFLSWHRVLFAPDLPSEIITFSNSNTVFTEHIPGKDISLTTQSTIVHPGLWKVRKHWNQHQPPVALLMGH